MDKLFWQVGYPKSGNTYLVELLRGMFLSKNDTEYGLSIADTPKTQSTNIPNWNDVKGTLNTPFGWTRCHTTFSRINMSMFAGGIYIIRHPFDVAVSAFRHQHKWMHKINVDEMPKDQYVRELSTYMDMFFSCDGDPAFETIGCGMWTENIHSWMRAKEQNPELPILIIKYEDLREDPIDCLITICELFGLNPANMGRAVTNASLDNMRSRDKNTFIGPASSGIWRDILTDRQITSGEYIFGRMMHIWGYSV